MADNMAQLEVALEGMSEDGLKLVLQFAELLTKIQRKEKATEIWQSALCELKSLLSKANYRTWLEKTVGLSYYDNQLVVGVPNNYVAEYLGTTLRPKIEKVLNTDRDITVSFRVL